MSGMTIKGFEPLDRELVRRTAAFKGVRVTVGYAAPYATEVHENLEQPHPTGEAKFLETPARTDGKRLGALVRELMRRGVPFPAALLEAAEQLKASSQELCPVLTGRLRGSAFVALDRVGD